MKRKYTTASGSVYIIDFKNMTWERKKGKNAADLRTDSGTFQTFQISNGYIYMTMPALNPDAELRFITSTQIVKVEDIK